MQIEEKAKEREWKNFKNSTLGVKLVLNYSYKKHKYNKPFSRTKRKVLVFTMTAGRRAAAKLAYSSIRNCHRRALSGIGPELIEQTFFLHNAHSKRGIFFASRLKIT